MSVEASVILKESNDIFSDIFKNKRERENNLNNVNVYFYRFIGFNDEDEYIDMIKSLQVSLKKKDVNYMKFMHSIPINSDIEYIHEAVNILKNLDKNIFDRGIERLYTSGFLNFTNIKETDILTRKALKLVLSLYCSNEMTMNLNIAINFICKMLLWCREILHKLFLNSDEEYIPKIIYFGNIKKHEIYLLILLSQCGCDVLYINSASDCDFSIVDKNNQYTKKIEFFHKKYINLDLVLQDEPFLKETLKIEEVNEVNIEKSSYLKVILNKNVVDPFKHILEPLASRTEYVQKPSLIIPVYFYRYLGIDGKDDDSIVSYKNLLYKIDTQFNSINNGYVRFMSFIPLNNYSKLNAKFDNIEDGLTFKESDINILLNRYIDLKVLPITDEPPLNNAIVDAFKKVLDLYLKSEKNNSLIKIKNFLSMMVIWINEYFPKLYKNLNFRECPKILFYGEIKLPEILFLIFFSSIGCDVLYMNPSEISNEEFSSIEKHEVFSVEIKLNDTISPFPFPTAHIPIRKSTENYKVQREVQNAIYDNDNISVFKPWQLENKIVRPITLKSTYDEVKLLLNEEAKFRPEFSFDKDNVYIPNFFVKIKGVYEDITDYWNDMRSFLNSKNVYFINTLPFTKIDTSINENYYSYLIENNRINTQKLYEDRGYKYNYLKTSLQNLIIDKANYLINSNHIFKQENNFQFELKVLKVLLNLSPQIIKMLELFDFPSIVPKLIIFHNNKEMLSQEDAIIIAFLNSCGADIIIFTPTNYNDIEQFIKEKLYDIYQLPKVVFNLNFNMNAVYSQKKKSFFQNFFK